MVAVRTGAGVVTAESGVPTGRAGVVAVAGTVGVRVAAAACVGTTDAVCVGTGVVLGTWVTSAASGVVPPAPGVAVGDDAGVVARVGGDVAAAVGVGGTTVAVGDDIGVGVTGTGVSVGSGVEVTVGGTGVSVANGVLVGVSVGVTGGVGVAVGAGVEPSGSRCTSTISAATYGTFVSVPSSQVRVSNRLIVPMTRTVLPTCGAVWPSSVSA